MAPSRGADTQKSISAFMIPVITDELEYLFQGILDTGEIGMLISTLDVTDDINTGDRITYESVDYKITRIIDWSDYGNIKAYSLKRETI